MALQLGALRDALIDAGASEEKAQRAAEELASYNTEFALIRDEMRQGFAKVGQRFAKVDQEFASVRGEMQQGFAKVDREFASVRGETQQGFAKVDQEFAGVRGDIHLLRWMVGANFALTLAVFVKLFVH